MSADSKYPSTGVLALLTGLLFALGPITVDLSLPAMPSMQRAIGSAAARIELTLTLFFLGFTIGQFLYGAVASRYGRRRPLLVCVAIYLIATFVGALAPNFVVFALGRVAQAIAFGAACVLIRSAVVELSDEKRTARIFSLAVTFTSIASVVAPAIGGALLNTYDWRAIFFAMAAYAVATWIALLIWMPETQQAERPRAEVLGGFSAYAALLKNGRFTALASVCACAAAFQLSYNTGTPAIIIDHYSVAPATAGILFSVIAITMAVTSQANAVLLKWIPPEKLMKFGALVSLISAAAILLCVFTGQGGVIALVASLAVLIASIGFILANAMAGAIYAAGPQAAAAAALVGVMQFLFGTVGSAFIGLIPDSQGRPMGVVIVLLGVVLFGMLLRAPRASLPAAGTDAVPLKAAGR